MDVSAWGLSNIISCLSWGALVVLLFVACVGAFARRAPILGTGLGLSAFSHGVGWTFSFIVLTFLSPSNPEVIQWFWPVNNLVHAVACTVIVVGVFKIPNGA